MPIIALILICAIFYSAFEIFAGLAGGKVDGWLAAVLYNGIGTVIPLIVYFASTVKGKTTLTSRLSETQNKLNNIQSYVLRNS